MNHLPIPFGRETEGRAVLSMQFIREHEAYVRVALAARGAEHLLDPILSLDAKRRTLLQELESLRSQRNRLSAAIGSTRDQAERQRLIDATAHPQARR